MMAKKYLLEFAVESTTELKAMGRLQSLGITNAEDAKLSDLDLQADLYTIRVSVDESDLSDETYRDILNAKDIYILSDELAAKRAKEIIELTAPIELQLKKLLICVLPETEKVLSRIIETHQRHKSSVAPASRIEWCRKISDFSFGELPKVLEEDVTKLAKQQLLSSEGLLSLVADAEDFSELKEELIELSKPKTIWSSICAVLEKPVKYDHLSAQLLDLCKARNEAAHLSTITAKRLRQVKKSKKHVMSYIGETKSTYRDDLRENMDVIAKSMKSLLDATVKIDPSIFTGYQNMISEIFKPVIDTVSRLQLDITSPAFSSIVQQNVSHQAQIAKGLSDSIGNIARLYPSDYQAAMSQFTNLGIPQSMLEYTKEMSKMRIELGDLMNKKDEQQENMSNKDPEKLDETPDRDPQDIGAKEGKR